VILRAEKIRKGQSKGKGGGFFLKILVIINWIPGLKQIVGLVGRAKEFRNVGEESKLTESNNNTGGKKVTLAGMAGGINGSGSGHTQTNTG